MAWRADTQVRPYGEIVAPYGEIAAPYGEIVAPYGMDEGRM